MSLREFVSDDEQPLSFAKIIPEPDDLHDRPATTGHLTDFFTFLSLRDALRDGEIREDALAEAQEMLRRLTPDEDGLDWYHWRLLRWGTKWDANFDSGAGHVPGLELPEGHAPGHSALLFDFVTAWSPPTSVVVVLGQKFPACTMTLRFLEVGNGFAGQLVVRGDRVEHVVLDADELVGPGNDWF